jgi:hypothetical protein
MSYREVRGLRSSSPGSCVTGQLTGNQGMPKGDRCDSVAPLCDKRLTRYRDTLSGSHVAGDDGQIVFMSRRGDHAVRRVERRSPQLRFAVEHSPAVGDGLSDRQDSSGKPGKEIVFQPVL